MMNEWWMMNEWNLYLFSENDVNIITKLKCWNRKKTDQIRGKSYKIVKTVKNK